MNLVWRLILGAVFVGALAALCIWDTSLSTPGMVLLPLAMLISVLAADELWAFAIAGEHARIAQVVCWTAAVVASNGVVVYWPLSGHAYPPHCPLGILGWPLVAIAFAFMAALFVEMRRYERPGETTTNLAAAALSYVYIGLFMSLLVHLRRIGGQEMLPLVLLIAVVKACDIGAYTFGRIFGRHKMAPVLSPGKTIEGAIGGLFLAAVASYLVHRLLGRADATAGVGWLVYGLVVGAAGIGGDLAESLLKRDAGQKDSSLWMPGFGGVLDVVDSILFAAPVAFALKVAGIG